jgi:hypothetical protein
MPNLKRVNSGYWGERPPCRWTLLREPLGSQHISRGALTAIKAPPYYNRSATLAWATKQAVKRRSSYAINCS